MSDYMEATALKVSDPSEPRILIVDDDEIIRLYLQCLLTENGYQVATASDFYAVKEALSSQAYALIIADLVFCEQAYSGLDIVKLIREHPAKISGQFKFPGDKEAYAVGFRYI